MTAEPERLTFDQQNDGHWRARYDGQHVATVSGPPNPRRWQALGVRGIARDLPAAIAAAGDCWRRLTRREAA
jgi:hypothetical protein